MLEGGGGNRLARVRKGGGATGFLVYNKLWNSHRYWLVIIIIVKHPWWKTYRIWCLANCIVYHCELQFGMLYYFLECVGGEER